MLVFCVCFSNMSGNWHFSLAGLINFALLWSLSAGSAQCYKTVLEFRWSLKVKGIAESPGRSKLSSEQREASFSSWRAAGVHAWLFDEWSHYIICLLYSRPPSTFLALSVEENNGPFVQLARAVLQQCDPLKNCFWSEQFPLRECGLIRAWECCLEARRAPCFTKGPQWTFISHYLHQHHHLHQHHPQQQQQHHHQHWDQYHILRILYLDALHISSHLIWSTSLHFIKAFARDVRHIATIFSNFFYFNLNYGGFGFQSCDILIYSNLSDLLWYLKGLRCNLEMSSKLWF